MVRVWVESHSNVLLALDAPLGWPAPMGEELSTHVAGGPIRVARNEFFRRHTDIFVQRTTGKTPLDVGADRIARTAHWAVSFLSKLRASTNLPIPLAWSPDVQSGVHAIEVYPAATLLAYGASLKGYKSAGGDIERRAVLEILKRQIACSTQLDECAVNPDALDAAVCALAGVDFLRGQAIAPENLGLAVKEGWIWFKATNERRKEPLLDRHGSDMAFEELTIDERHN
jgi:hypothetical protein